MNGLVSALDVPRAGQLTLPVAGVQTKEVRI